MGKFTKNILAQFDTLAEFVRATEPDSDRHNGLSAARVDSHKTEWTGTPSLPQAVEWAQYGGWEHGVGWDFDDAIERIAGKVKPVESWNPEVVYDVTGHVGFDIDRAMVGNPECFLNEQPRWGESKSNVVTILIDQMVSAYCDGPSLLARGRAILGLVRCLQSLGMDLEVWSEISNKGNDGRIYSQLVCLKKAGQVSDTEGVEFAIGNPSMLRRFHFAMLELLPDKRNWNVGGGYGRVIDAVHAETVGADLVLNLKRNWGMENGSEEKLESWIAGMLDDAGVEHGLLR